jgi:hypothetical protein
MYSKTGLGADQLSGGPPLSRKSKRVLILVLAVAAAIAVGFGVWSAVSPDTYGPSANGCVNVTIASSTGGATLHYCGAAAVAVPLKGAVGWQRVHLKAPSRGNDSRGRRALERAGHLSVDGHARLAHPLHHCPHGTPV